MKDVTVALELTLPKGVSDQEIKSFVEEALKAHLLTKRHDWKETTWNSIDWEKQGILGIFEHMIDVVAVQDGTFLAPGKDGWRELPIAPTLQVNEGGTTTIHE
jgi:hypothetical protein